MPHVKLRDGAELYYESRGGGRPVPGPGLGGDGRSGTQTSPDSPNISPWSCMIIAARRAARSSKITYSVEQMADDALQLIDALGYDKVHWCGHSTGSAMGQVLAIEHPDRIDRLVLSATWAKTDAFFRRLFEVRSLVLKELGPLAYLKSSALALNMPSWVRDHDADLAIAEAKAAETIPSRRSCCRASPLSWPMTGGEQLQKVRALRPPSGPRRHGHAVLLHARSWSD